MMPGARHARLIMIVLAAVVVLGLIATMAMASGPAVPH